MSNQNQKAVVLTEKLNGEDFELSITTRTVDPKEFGNKARVYFHASGETIGEQLFNRHDRPYKLYRQFMPAVLKATVQLLDDSWKKSRISDPSITFGWSKHAGCTMCPCSPGFILSLGFNTDVYVSIKSKVNVKTVGKPVSLEHAANTMNDLAGGAIVVHPEPEDDYKKITPDQALKMVEGTVSRAKTLGLGRADIALELRNLADTLSPLLKKK